MRVSNHLVSRTIAQRLLSQQSALARAQERVATGRRVGKMSDDPTAGSTIMQASGSLRGIEQYRRNADTVGARLDAEDAVLEQLTQIMTRAKELGIATMGSTVDASGRRMAGLELKQLLEQAVNLGNTRLGDEFLFGGTNNDGRAPFTSATPVAGATIFVPTDPPVAPATDPTPRLPTGQRTVEIAAGQTMRGAHDGASVFLASGALDALHALGNAMDTDDLASMGSAMGALDRAFGAVQGMVGEVGARQNQVDTVRAGLDALHAALAEQKSGLSEVEMEEAITEMMQRQTAYQAAMLASSKVMGMSLTDYLR
jgi:flagellar hook-associated protein 3 FlgL